MSFVQRFAKDDSGDTGFVQGDNIIYLAHSATGHQIEVGKFGKHFLI